MKNIFKYILAAAAVSLAATACVEEEIHAPGEADLDGCYGVYFPAQDASGSHTYDPSMPTEVVFKASRKVSTGKITVPLAVSASEEGIFNVGTLEFEDGQSESEVKVTFPDSKNGVEYSISLSINDPQYASKYLNVATNIDFSVLRVEWKEFLNPVTNQPAIVTFNEGWWDEVHTATIKYYEVDGVRYCVATCNETDDGGKQKGIWGDTQGVTFDFIWDTKTHNSDGYDVIDVKKQYFGFDYNDNSWASVPETQAEAPVYFYDWYHFLTTDGGYAGNWGSWANFLKANPDAYAQSYYDGNGGFYFNLKYFIPSLGGGFTPDVFDVVAIADGFVRVDYSIEVTTDYPENGLMPLYFETGADVTTIKYIAVEGKPTPNQLDEFLKSLAGNTAKDIQEIKEFILDETTGKNNSAAAVSFKTSGTYSIIAGAFDKKGEMQESTSIVLNYIAADDSSVDVKLTVGVEDTPKRYESAGHNVYNSLGYYVSVGEDATDVKVGLYTTATVDKFGMDAVLSDLRYEDEKTNSSVSADILDEMKAVGGYYSLMTSLKDNTSYTLVVWATNGNKATFEAVEYTTAKYPEVWKSLGTGLYTDDLIAPGYGAPNVSYKVTIEESEETPGKYRLVNPYGEAFPYNEPGDWDDSQDYPLVIYASNPERVYFGLQSTGCDWGDGEMSVLSMAWYYMSNGQTADEVAEAGLFGTLKDGVITFPVKALGLVLGGTIYYGNPNGAFKVVLPSAYTETDEEATTASVSSSIKGTGVKSGKEFGKARLSVGQKTYVSYEREIRPVEITVSNISSVRKDKNNKEISFKADRNILR